MSDSVNFGDLYNESKDAEGGEDISPPDGTTFVVDFPYAEGKMQGGKLRIQARSRVISDGEWKGGEFWNSLFFSPMGGTDGQKSHNKKLFAKLLAAGLTEEFFASNPAPAAIGNALKKATVEVVIGWSENEDKPNDPWADHKWRKAPEVDPFAVDADVPAGFGSEDEPF